MKAKQLQFDKEARDLLLSGITKLSDAVKSTLGPAGNTVLIESQEHTRGLTVTKDGVTVAKSIYLPDPVENLAVRVLKEAAKETATDAGDGTTTAIVLAEQLVRVGTEIMKDSNLNRTEVLRHLSKLSEKIQDDIRSVSSEVGPDEILNIATISANNDNEVGKIVADVYKEVGVNSVVSVEKSVNHKTYAETTKGIQVDRGYTSPLFVNNHESEEFVHEDVYVLLCDTEINDILQLDGIFEKVIKNKLSLLIIAPFSKRVTNTLAANVMRYSLKVCNVPPPDFGYRQHELMQDIALAVGATYFSEKTGDDLSIIKFEDLGKAKKVIVGKDKTAIIIGDQDVDEKVSQLEVSRDKAKTGKEKDFINKRIASLRGGVGVIYAGGSTDLEQKELADRIDDSIRAVRSALDEGVLPGAGRCLYGLSKKIKYIKKYADEYNAAVEILKIALKEPMCQILRNAGLEFDDIYKRDGNDIYYGYDLKKKEYGDLRKLGVVDPARVTRTALNNAVSVATTILSTNCVVTMLRE